MKSQCKFKEHSIVLLGNFNPKIFQPAWFASEGLLKQQEADEATIEIIHSTLVIFQADWLRLEVTQDRFNARTSLEPYDRVLRDLVLGTFSLLQYTPIMQMGINRQMHFQVDSTETWHKAGNTLAPKEIWEGVLTQPGMLSVQMRESERVDGFKGNINVKIEPSTRVHPGIFFTVNDHIERKDSESSEGAREIMDILGSHWETSYKRSAEIITTMLERIAS